MKRKSKKFKIFVSIVCLLGMLGNIMPVSAEDREMSVLPEILRLEGSLTVSAQSGVSSDTKFLALRQPDNSDSVLSAPFGKTLQFPEIMVLNRGNQALVYPSDFVINNLDEEFKYFYWNFEDPVIREKLQLPESPDYVLHIGDAIGLPIDVRWGIRKTGKTALEEFPVEHVLEYQNQKGNWVRAITRGINWSSPLQGHERFGIGESIDHGTVYWKRIPKVENLSPLVEDVTPEPEKSINKNNIGKIDGVLVSRNVKIGSDYDLSSGINVVGAVTRKKLAVSNADIIPEGHFKITHNTSGIDDLITGMKYTAVGKGKVVSTVTDYQDDATEFTQEVIVSSTGKTGINIYYAGTSDHYQFEWMSNNSSANKLRQGGLVLQSNSSIPGTYDLVTMIGGSEIQSKLVENNDGSLIEGARRSWTNTDTTEAGIPVTSRAYLTNNRATMLANESDPKHIRFDSTVPTINNVYPVDSSWKEIEGTDANDELSGLETESGGVYYKFVEHGATEGVTTPKNDKDWTSLKKYEMPPKGEYDLYVYAKDNATNRSQAIKANNDPIIVSSESAMICLAKTVSAYDGGSVENQDIFLVHVKEDEKTLGSVALKQNETSEWMEIHMNGEESRTIEIVEVVPMDYDKEYRISVMRSGSNEVFLDKGETEIILYPGDEIKITIDNIFEHAGYFRGKDSVKNLFINEMIS